MTDLRERPIVITGAASGMGRSTALALAERGHPVFLVDIDEDGLAKLERELSATKPQVAVAVADVGSRVALTAAFDESRRRFGECWGLAAVAGLLRPTPVLEANDPVADLQIDVNFRGVLLSNQLAAQQMVARGRGGRILNWGSDGAVGANPGFGVYGAMKAAVLSLTRTNAIELAEYGITVNAIMPGATDTPLANYLSALEKDEVAKRNPLGRWGTPDEMATFAAFIFTDASSYMTGTTLLIDGGATAAMGRHLRGRLSTE